MKRAVLTLTAVVLACGVAYGQQQPGPNYEHLKVHGVVIGTWRYEGPSLEDMPGVANKDTKCVQQITWRWILNRNAIEVTWSSEFEGGKTISGKGLIGWNAADKKITYGGMDSLGSMGLGTIEFADGGKTSTLTEKGIDGEGKEISGTAEIKMTGEDTFTWQATERSGGLVDGPSPIYSFKRVERARSANGASRLSDTSAKTHNPTRPGTMLGRF